MRTATFVLCLMLLCAVSVSAQDGYPLPNHLQPITVENAAQLKHLASLGGVLPYSLNWSHKGNKLISATSEGVQIYDLNQPQLPPSKISGVTQAYFDANDRLILDGHYADEDSEQSANPTLAPTSTPSSLSTEPKVNVRTQNDEVIIDVHKTAGEIISLHLKSDASFREIIFSPDKQYAVVVMDYTVDDYNLSRLLLWNMVSGKQIALLADVFSGLIKVMFRGNGNIILATAYYSGEGSSTISIWDGHTGKRLAPTSTIQGPAVFSSDEQFIAAFVDGHIQIWTDHLLGSFDNLNYRGGEPEVPFAFSPDNRTFAKTGANQIELWDVTSQAISIAPRLIIPTSDNITYLSYSPDGKLLVSKIGKAVELWDAHTGAKVPLLSAAEEVSISLPTFSADGQFMFTDDNSADINSSKLVWDIKQSSQIAALPTNTAFTDDHLWAAYWVNGKIRVLDIRNNRPITLNAIDNNLGWIIAFNPTNGLGFFAGQNSVIGYDLHTGREVMQKAKGTGFDEIVFNADGSYFISRETVQKTGPMGSLATSLWRTYDLQKPVSNFETLYEGQQLLLSPNGKVFSSLDGLCGEGGGGIYSLWNTITGEDIAHPNGGSCGPNAQAFSPDGKWLLIGWDGPLEIIDIDQAIAESDHDKSRSKLKFGEPISTDYPGEHHIVFSSDGTMVAITHDIYDEMGQVAQHNISLYRFSDLLTQKGDDLGEGFLTIQSAQSAIFSPDNHWLLTDIGLWNLETRQQVSSVAGSIAAFTHDSNLLAIYDEKSSKIRLWDMSKVAAGDSSPINELENPRRNQGYQDELAFSPDTTLLYLKLTGDIQIWGVEK